MFHIVWLPSLTAVCQVDSYTAPATHVGFLEDLVPQVSGFHVAARPSCLRTSRFLP